MNEREENQGCLVEKMFKIQAYRKVGKKKVYGGYSKIIEFKAK